MCSRPFSVELNVMLSFCFQLSPFFHVRGEKCSTLKRGGIGQEVVPRMFPSHIWLGYQVLVWGLNPLSTFGCGIQTSFLSLGTLRVSVLSLILGRLFRSLWISCWRYKRVNVRGGYHQRRSNESRMCVSHTFQSGTIIDLVPPTTCWLDRVSHNKLPTRLIFEGDNGILDAKHSHLMGSFRVCLLILA